MITLAAVLAISLWGLQPITAAAGVLPPFLSFSRLIRRGRRASLITLIVVRL